VKNWKIKEHRIIVGKSKENLATYTRIEDNLEFF
jgi:hypothetical protein